MFDSCRGHVLCHEGVRATAPEAAGVRPFARYRRPAILKRMLLTLSIIGAALLLVMGVHAYAAWTIRDLDQDDEH
jgi:hypothetical protein